MQASTLFPTADQTASMADLVDMAFVTVRLQGALTTIIFMHLDSSVGMDANTTAKMQMLEMVVSLLRGNLIVVADWNQTPQ